MNQLEIKHLSETEFDVFWGDGWANWARVHNNNGFLKPTAGIEIPKAIFATLISMFSKKGK